MNWQRKEIKSVRAPNFLGVKLARRHMISAAIAVYRLAAQVTDFRFFTHVVRFGCYPTYVFFVFLLWAAYLFTGKFSCSFASFATRFHF